MSSSRIHTPTIRRVRKLRPMPTLTNTPTPSQSQSRTPHPHHPLNYHRRLSYYAVTLLPKRGKSVVFSICSPIAGCQRSAPTRRQTNIARGCSIRHGFLAPSHSTMTKVLNVKMNQNQHSEPRGQPDLHNNRESYRTLHHLPSATYVSTHQRRYCGRGAQYIFAYDALYISELGSFGERRAAVESANRFNL